MAQVKAVCVSDAKGQPKHPAGLAELRVNFGIVGDAHAGADTHRQVSLMDEKSIEVMRQKGYDASDGDFGENFVTVGLPIEKLGIGTVLQIGSSVQIKITQIGKECHTPCAIGRRTGECIMPREGIFAEVTAEGKARAGDEITIIKEVGRAVVQVAVVTVSDRCSAGKAEDTSGPLIGRTLTESLRCNVAQQCIVPDEKEIIAERLKELCQPERYIDLIFTTGGTGLAPRDVTPEATGSVIDRAVPGIGEVIRQQSLAITPRAMLSRGIAGIRNSSLIVNLPGSKKAVSETLAMILPVLPHAVELLRGQVADCGREAK